MDRQTQTDRAAFGSRDRWLHPLLITGVVGIGYGIGPTRLPLVGEESCRAQHGIEMAASGDWLIPTQQGVEYLDRPPLQYWTLALIERWIHALDPLTVRLFMAVVTLAVALVVWRYARRFLSSAGALVAGLAYPTMGHVFDLGRRVETDGYFTLLVGASLLVWHYGYDRGWSKLATWISGAAVAGLAALCKGLQAPVAFFGTVYLFLLLRREWRWLWHGSHAVGILTFLGVIAIWQIPFFEVAGWEGTRMSWFDPSTSRVAAGTSQFLLHLVKFPIAVFGACLPWSVLLLAVGARRFWRLPPRQTSCAVFALLTVATIAGPVWIAPYGTHRYAMPMYPALAVLCGLAAERCLASDASVFMSRVWRGLLGGTVAVISLVAVMAVAATAIAPFTEFEWIAFAAQPWWLAVTFALVTAAGAGAIYRRLRATDDPAPQVAATALAVLLAACFNGPVLNVTTAIAVEIGPSVVALRERLPAGSLVSFEPLHHKFVYWYADPVPILPMPGSAAELPENVEYFAVNLLRGEALELPFEWERIAALNMDRREKPDPYDQVIVGRFVR